MESTVRTIVFTDLVNSVKMYSKITDAVAVDLVRNLEQQIQQILPGFKGQFIKSTGDGQLLAFEQASDAARCALALHAICGKMAAERRQELALRIAAHTGPIVLGESDLHGNTVNLAARLLSVTGSGEICVSAECWAGMTDEDRQSYVPHGPEVFKGFTKYTFVHKRPSPQYISDTTVRHGTDSEKEISPLLLQALAKSPVYQLELDHPQLKKSIKLTEGQTHVIGRAPECSTQVPDSLFSASHAAFAVVEGICWCFDLQSTNGTAYRGRRIKHRVPVAAPETIQFPSGTIKVTIPE